jgi:hypothetical protein
MHINFGPRGILQVDDARIIHRNFAGAGSEFNAEGSRNFSLVIEDREVADALVEEGWNVKIREREDGEPPFMFLPVKVKFNERGPAVVLISGDSQKELNEDTVEMLDYIDILKVDLDIRPYDWTLRGGKTGRTAYLQKMYVTQELDRFAERYGTDD